jgi:formyltetrahydrofolate-dependent phosphoribosylglycinamide formyltransferase
MVETGKKRLRVAVGVSGGGRSLVNLLKEQAKHSYEIVLVFSSSKDIPANDLARSAGIPLVIEDFSMKNRVAAAMTLYGALQRYSVDLVVLAGFLKLMPMDPAWSGKIINIHPALLPKFGGKGMHGHHVHEAVLESGESHSGASVHLVNERYDEGAIISQATVLVLKEDNVESLAARVFAAECKLLPWTIDAMAQGELPAATVAQLHVTHEV